MSPQEKIERAIVAFWLQEGLKTVDLLKLSSISPKLLDIGLPMIFLQHILTSSDDAA